MKTYRTALFHALAALTVGAAAIGAQAQTQANAQTPAQNAGRPHLTHEQREAKRAEYMAQRAARLHADLRITPAQENAWAAFVASMKPSAANAQHMDRASWAALPAPARMQKMIDMQKQRTVQMEQRLSALNTFYSVLSADQKQVFDADTARMQRGWGHGGQGGWQHRGQSAQG